jgi:hypothetical protein
MISERTGHRNVLCATERVASAGFVSGKGLHVSNTKDGTMGHTSTQTLAVAGMVGKPVGYMGQD